MIEIVFVLSVEKTKKCEFSVGVRAPHLPNTHQMLNSEAVCYYSLIIRDKRSVRETARHKHHFH